MLFSYVSGQQQISNNKKCRQIAGNFDCHVDAAVRRGAHCPIEHIQGFTRSHWMLPSGECRAVLPQRPPWLMNLNKTHKTLTKHNFYLATMVHFER
jgi:hypothetical protein